MDKIQFKIWNKKDNRPANNYEIDRLINDENDKQLFLNWLLHPSKDKEGIVEISLDSGYGSNFELRIIDSTEFI